MIKIACYVFLRNSEFHLLISSLVYYCGEEGESISEPPILAIDRRIVDLALPDNLVHEYADCLVSILFLLVIILLSILSKFPHSYSNCDLPLSHLTWRSHFFLPLGL